MSQQLEIFMEKLLREITEGIPTPRRVRLIADGTTFESWEPIHGVGINPAEWAKEAELLIQALIPELPKRRVQLSFVAEDGAGATVSTLLRTVTGQNASAQDLGTQNGAKALADAIASVAKTMDATLETARKMLEFQCSQLEKAHSQLGDAHELFMAIKKAELESEDQENVASRILLEQVQGAAPMLMAILENWASKQPSKVAQVAQVATSAATAATNGVKAS